MEMERVFEGRYSIGEYLMENRKGIMFENVRELYEVVGECIEKRQVDWEV
jgi:hypothetical protein